MASLTIKTDGYRGVDLQLDGSSIAKATRRLNLEMSACAMPVANLEVLAKDLDVVVAADVHIDFVTLPGYTVIVEDLAEGCKRVRTEREKSPDQV